LSSLEGYAITSVKIAGISQEFSSIAGVMEDVTDIILNLKQIRFKSRIENQTSERTTIFISGKEEFLAGDINNHLNFFQVLNPELLICRMEPKVKLQMEITIDKGAGYVPAEDNKTLHEGIDVITMDSIHTPIKNVKYIVDNYRVEQKTDFEKLILEITTDGSIHPLDALKESAKILIQHFILFTDDKKMIDVDIERVGETPEGMSEEDLLMRQTLMTKLADMELSVRAINCLKQADLKTLGDLVMIEKSALLKFRNFGKKSLQELEDLVNTQGLNFGMNVAKYKLDKE